jgi:hypothetical protein
MARGQGGVRGALLVVKMKIVQFVCKLSRGGPPKHSSHPYRAAARCSLQGLAASRPGPGRARLAGWAVNYSCSSPRVK